MGLGQRIVGNSLSEVGIFGLEHGRQSVMVHNHDAQEANTPLADGGEMADIGVDVENKDGAAMGETAYGKVQGVHNNGIYTFKGIPYGASTAGANRFMPPRKPEPWSGVRPCLDWGPMCPQVSGGGAMATGMGRDFGLLFGVGAFTITSSEDCLVLNVFTPGLGDGKKRPVMVWLHGGGFNIGTGSGPRTDGTNLARAHDVVSVSLNHRLGVLGYCHLGDIDRDFAQSGNAGQLDLIAALEWVRDNIENFGGDPNNVLIHGESGGGAKVHTLMAMPAAKGLFHRAVCQSGVVGGNGIGIGLPDRKKATDAATALIKGADLKTEEVGKLQELPVGRLLALASPTVAENPFAPVIGTADLPETPSDAIAKGSAARVPFMIGCTKHEANFFLATMGADRQSITEEQLVPRLSRLVGERAPALMAGLRKNHPDFTPGDILVRAMTDSFARFTSTKVAEAHIHGGGAPTFMYQFEWESPALPHLQSCHGIDGGFYFDNTEALGMTAGYADALQLAAKCSAAWAAFARSGNPSNPELGDWPQYSKEARATMILSNGIRIENDPMAADRLLWESVVAS
jgi:para-nitrobenzyl esterase